MSKYTSKWMYYISIAFVLIIFDFFVLFAFVPMNPDLGYNIFSEVWGIIATVLLLMLIVEVREHSEWKNVEIWVKTRMGKQLFNLFNILSRFIYPEIFSPVPSKEKVLTILEAINEMKEATLTEYAYNHFPKPASDMSVYQLDILFRYRRYLSDLEIKYFRFIKPKIRISLMEIQKYLDSIEADFDLVKRFESSETVVEKSMVKSILGILKEIYKISQAGTAIYPKQN